MLKIKEFVFNAFGENTFIIWDDVSLEGAVIDPGMDNEEEKNEIDTFVSRNNIKVIYLILTHLHIDHVWGVPHFREKYGLPVTAHNDGEYLGAIIDAQAQMFGLRQSPGKIEIENTVKDGDILKLGKEKIEIFHVPGHSPGGIVIYAPQQKFLIAGDVLFRNSIGRTDLPGGNYKLLIAGIKDKILTMPDDTIVYPGHGPITTIGYERLHNPFLA